MKKRLYFILLLCCSHWAWAQEPWQMLGNFPGTPRDDASGIVCKGYGYMGTGFGTGFVYLDDWWRYDFDTDTWTSRANLPASPRQYTAIASINDQVYLLGGITPSGCSDELWTYHTLTDQWELVTHFPGGGRQAPVLMAVDNKLYTGLGRCGTNYYKDWWEFDPQSLTWNELTSFPGEARFDPVQAVVNEEVLVGAGLSASGGEQDVYVYVPAFGIWKTLTDFPGCGIFYTVQAAQDNTVYVVNGSKANYDFCPGAYVYEAGHYADHWKNWYIDALHPVSRGGVGFLYRNRFYYVCGLDSSGNRLNKVQYVNIQEPGLTEEDSLLLYPVITTDYICLESTTELEGTVSVYNAAGQPAPVTVPAVFSHYARLDVSKLSTGIYIVRIMDGKKIRVRKFIRL